MIILIARLVNQYINEAYKGKIILTPDEMGFINELSKNIHAFFHIQKSWLALGLLGSYWEKASVSSGFLSPNFNQTDLIAESRKAILDSFRFAHIMCERLYEKTKKGGSYAPVRQSHPYREFLIRINKLLKESMEFLQAEHEKIEAYTTEKILDCHFYNLASQLNGRYIYSDQRFDPLAFIHSGTCYGHVLSWRDAVVKTGKCIAMSRNDMTNFNYQLSQTEYLPDFYETCQNHMHIWSAVEKLLSKCRKDGIYLWSYNFCRNQSGHAFGIRKLKNKEIECFDPNLGIFIFPENTFSLWFTHILSCYLYDDSLFDLEVSHIGAQPASAAATIPPIQLNKSNTLACDYFFNQIPYFSLLVGFRKDLKKEIVKSQKEILHITIEKINAILEEKLQLKKCYEKNDNEKYHVILKNKAVMTIDQEIEKSKGEFGHANMLDINILVELQAKIVNAEIGLSLKTLVNIFLHERCAGSNLTYKQILHDGRVHTFIHTFVSNHEINPFYMRFLQERIKARIIDIVSIQLVFLGENNISAPYKNIIKIFRDTSGLEVLLLIQKNLVKFSGFFSFAFNNEEKNNNEFYKIVRELQLDNPFSLLQTHQKLRYLSVYMEEAMKNQYVSSLKKNAIP